MHSCGAVLVDWLRVSEVWVGANFLFGRDRQGNFSLLRNLGQTYGFRAEKIDPVRYRDFIVAVRASAGSCPRAEWTRQVRCLVACTVSKGPW
jgi:FAD synthase